ncbi:hypothetical protein NDU88_002711 [Pleurodeles waltl]|uniref:Uncharacterized protein n=1 Tax=Pleurodeles waltl TaxID=8319 RepID=A0AAV7LGG1_PLEWA|nr:hypothetical protein NDU88_002711 [Pleurodeles waltl]
MSPKAHLIQPTRPVSHCALDHQLCTYCTTASVVKLGRALGEVPDLQAAATPSPRAHESVGLLLQATIRGAQLRNGSAAHRDATPKFQLRASALSRCSLLCGAPSCWWGQWRGGNHRCWPESNDLNVYFDLLWLRCGDAHAVRPPGRPRIAALAPGKQGGRVAATSRRTMVTQACSGRPLSVRGGAAAGPPRPAPPPQNVHCGPALESRALSEVRSLAARPSGTPRTRAPARAASVQAADTGTDLAARANARHPASGSATKPQPQSPGVASRQLDGRRPYP